ncbi:MAG: hypothetical protein KC496_05500 [Anaerolineae bacterium]|nr:hypothetical protein [Anaerolineae bacterium]
MNPAQEQDLKDMRRAAQERDQYQLQFLLKRLLRGMEFYVALSVSMERASAFIDIFDSYYPGEPWVRQLLLAINAFGTKPDDTIAEAALSQKFSAPGAGNYLKAVYDITQAMNSNHTLDARIGFLASAVVNEIMAELAEAYYGDREDDWQRVRANTFDPETGEASDPDAAEIAYQFWIAPETATLDSGLWLEVADSIERKLQRMKG